MIQLDYDLGGKSEIVDVDQSATTHGATITVRRHRYHEGIVLAARASYRANLEMKDAQP